MRVGDKQFGDLNLNQNDITNVGDVGKALSSAIPYWKLIQEVWLPEDAATIEFNSIPQNFRHLVIVASVNTAAIGFVTLRLNNDTAANYDAAVFVVNDSAALSGTGGDGPAVTQIPIGAAGSLAGSFSPLTVAILDYANTTRHKAVHSIGGNLRGTLAGDIQTGIGSGRWRNTVAVTAVTLRIDDGTNLKSGSMASLYGTDV